MFRIHLVLLVLALSVSACANSPPTDAPTPARRVAKPYLTTDKPLTRSRTDRFKRIATGDATNAVSADEENLKREETLRRLTPNSTAWWAVYDEIEAAKDRQLRQRLVICRGCFPARSEHDATGSISPPRLD